MKILTLSELAKPPVLPRNPPIRRRNESELRASFWSKVEIVRNDECWIWKAGHSSNGRPIFWCANKQRCAYRIAWLLTHGTLREDLNICHTCDNERCVNPSHLFEGTDLDNVHDKLRKKRQPFGEQCGSPTLKLTEPQVVKIRASGDKVSTLAKQYKVWPSTIRQIKNGNAWKHLLPDDQRFAGLKSLEEIRSNKSI